MNKRSYVTTKRVDALKHTLTRTEWRIINDVDRIGLISGAQLRRLHYDDDSNARRMCRLHLARLSDQRVLLRHGRRVGGVRSGSDGFVYALDILGQRLIAPTRSRSWRPRTPGAAFFAHALQVAELYVQLRITERRNTIRLLRFDTEPRCWCDFAGLGGERQTLKPDAYAVIENCGTEHHFFVEIDRATESIPRIMDKARTYVQYWQSGRHQFQHDVFPLVLFSVPTARRRQQITDCLARLKPEHWQLFAAATWEATGELMSHDESDGGVT